MPPKKSKKKSSAITGLIGLFILGVIFTIVYFTIIQPKMNATKDTTKDATKDSTKEEKKPVDGKLSDWSEWSKCNKECGPGQQTRTRTYTKPVDGGKNPKDYDKLKESKNCEIKPCPINATLTKWEKEGTCVRFDDKRTPIDCGSGTQKLIRKYLPALYGGLDTISYEDRNILEKWEECSSTKPCPEATVSTWINIKDNNNGYTETDNIINYYYIKDNNKIYITDKDKNKICYDNTIKIGNNNLKVADIKYDQVRKFTPGGSSKIANEETMDKLIKNLQNKGEIKPEEIDNIKKTNIQKITISLKSDSKEILACTPINEACSVWKDSGSCQCKDNKFQKKQVRTYTASKYGGTKSTDTKCAANNIEIWIDCIDNGNPKAKCPTDGVLTKFSTVSQTGQNPNDNCLPDYGRNRYKIEEAEYTFPFIKTGHNQYINDNFSPYYKDIKELDINKVSKEYTDFNGNIITFTRINSEIPEKYKIIKKIKCNDLGRTTQVALNSLWKNETKCNIDLNNNILLKNKSKTLEEYLFDTDTGDFKTNISPWKSDNILQYTLPDNNRSIMKNNIDILKDCYSKLPLIIDKNNQSQYYSTNNIIKKNIIYPGVDYTNDAFWETDNYRLKINFQGNLDIVHKTKNIKLWEQNANPTSTGTILSMQNDGNLVLYKDSSKKNSLWDSGTLTSGAYAELLEFGTNSLSVDGLATISYPLLVIKNNSGNIIKKINPIEIINKISTWATIYNNLSTKYPLEINENDTIIFTDTNVIHPSIRYKKNYKWTNGDFKLDLNNDLHAIIYNKNNERIFYTETPNNPSGYFILEDNGNLVIYNNLNNRQVKWKSDTMGHTVPYAELTSKGYLILNNHNLNVLKAFPENIIETYLKDKHWKDSPRLLMMSYKNKIWKVKNSDFNNFYNSDNKDFSFGENNNYTSGGKPFNGWTIDYSGGNDTHILNYKSIKLDNINNYDNEDEGDTPNYNGKNWTGDNWVTENDKNNFDTNKKNRKFPTKSDGTKADDGANAIPGYFRISRNSFGDIKGEPSNITNRYFEANGFITYDATGTADNPAWILFIQTDDKEAYANDIINNNKSLIKNIINNEDKLKQIIKDYTGKDDFAYKYRDIFLKPQYGISSFTNKSECYNISNFYNKQNYNISKIHDIEYFISSKKIKPRQKNKKNNFNNKLHTSYLEMIKY
jgi:hypothetical protein